jgi:hypothetical protein
MEPNLIPKYLRYLKKKKKGGINGSPKVNDSGVTLEDMQSNDYWGIAFLLLLTHDPRFGMCYTYQKDNPPDVPIKFHPDIFRKLFRKVLHKYESDQNFCYVMSRLCGFYRFHSQDSYQDIYQPVNYSKRDLKFFVWLLTYARFPEQKVIAYEEGDHLREVDEYATMASNDSLYDSASQEYPLESEVKQFKTGKQILETIDQNNRIIEKVKQEYSDTAPEYQQYQPELYDEPTYSFFEQKSYVQKQVSSKQRFNKETPTKMPTQSFEKIPHFTYQKSVKNIKQVNYDIIYNFNKTSGIQRSSKMMMEYSYKSMDKSTPTKMMRPVDCSKVKDRVTQIPQNFPLVHIHFESPSDPMPLLPRPVYAKELKSFPPKKKEIYQKVESPEKTRAGDLLEEPRYVEPEKWNPLEDKIMRSLRQMSKRKIEVTRVDDVKFEEDFEVSKRKNTHHVDSQNNCQCKLCRKAKKRGPRKVSKRPLLPSFDTKKSFEENQKVRLESRIKRVSRVRYRQDPQYEDPYKTRKDSPPKLQIKKYSTGVNDFTGRVSRFETSHYKTSKHLQFQKESRESQHGTSSHSNLQRYFNKQIREVHPDDPKKPKFN